MANEDLILKISADAQQFEREMRKVEKVTEEASKKAADADKKARDQTKLTLRELREKAREEARLGREAQKIYESTRTEAEKYKQQVDSLKEHLKAGRLDQESFNRAMEKAKTAMKDSNQAATEALGRDAQKIYESTRTEAEKYKQEVDRLRQHLQTGRLDQETFNRAMEKAKKAMENASKSTNDTQAAVDQLKARFAAMVHPAALAAAAIALVIAELKKSREAFLEHQQSVREMGLAWAALGEDATKVQGVFQRNAEAFGFSIQEQRTALTTLAHASGDMVQAEFDLQRAMNVSRATNASLTDSAKALSEARKGNVSGLHDLYLISAQQLRQLNEIEDQNHRASTAIRMVDDATKDAAKEAEGAARGFNKLKVAQEEMTVAAGKWTDAAVKAGKAVWDFRQGVTPWLWGKAWNAVMGSAKDATDDTADSVRDLRQEIEWVAQGPMLGMSESYWQSHRRNLEAQRKEEERQRKERARAAAEELRQARIRTEQAVYDVEILREQDEIARERLRLAKELYTLRETTKNNEELIVKTALAQETSAARILEIQKQQLELAMNPVHAAIKRAQEDADSARLKTLEDGRRLTEQLRTPQEAYNAKLREVNELFKAGAIDAETYRRAEKAALEELQSRLEKSKKEIEGFARDAAETLYRSFADFLFDPFDKSLEDMAQNFARTLGRMALDSAQKSIFESIFSGGGGASAAASLIGFSGGGYTGPGPKHQPAGLVHKDEFVFTKEATRKIGPPALYSLMHLAEKSTRNGLSFLYDLMGRAHKGYANGGLVGAASAPATAAGPVMQQQSGVNIKVVAVGANDDPRSYLASSEGERVIMAIIGRNTRTIRQMVNN